METTFFVKIYILLRTQDRPNIYISTYVCYIMYQNCLHSMLFINICFPWFRSSWLFFLYQAFSNIAEDDDPLSFHWCMRSLPKRSIDIEYMLRHNLYRPSLLHTLEIVNNLHHFLVIGKRPFLMIFSNYYNKLSLQNVPGSTQWCFSPPYFILGTHSRHLVYFM